MERDALSVRQMMVLLVTALLAPMSDLLPSVVAQKAGSAGWLAALGAFPLLLLALWAAGRIVQSGGIGKVVSGIPKYFVIVVYLAWTLLILMLALRLSAARLAVVYGKGPAFCCAAALLVVAIWMGVGKTAALARAGEVFYLALAVALAGVLFLAAFHVESENLCPTAQEAAALPESSVMAAGLLLNIVPAAVLGHKVSVKPKNSRRVVGWAVVFCTAITLLLAAVIGCLGPRLTARLPAPFYIMVQGLGIKGAFQRTEALVSSLWTLSDLTLFGLLLHTWRELASQLHPGKWSRWSVIPAAVAAAIGGWILFASEEKTWKICGEFVPAVGLILGLLIPMLAQMLLVFRKKK